MWIPHTHNTVGSDVVKEQYNVAFPADTSGKDVSRPVTIHIIGDNIAEPEEGFFLFITTYTSLNQSNSTNVSEDVEVMDRVALVRIRDDDFVTGNTSDSVA